MLRRGTDRAMRGKEIQRCRIEKRAMRSSTHYQGILVKRQKVTLKDGNHSSVQTGNITLLQKLFC